MMATHCIFVYIRKHELGLCMCVISKQIFSCPSFIYKSVLKATDKFVTIKNMRSNIKFIRFPFEFHQSFYYLSWKRKKNKSIWSNIVWYEIIMTCNCFVVKGDVFLFLVHMLMWAPNSLSHSLYMYTTSLGIDMFCVCK